MSETTDESLSRRRLLAGAGAVVAAAAVTAACGSSSEPSGTSTTGTSPDESPSPTGGGGSGETVAALADIPVGGGVVITARKVVLTQPAAGDVRAYTAVCPHQGCLVASVSDNVIVCPCHSSEFSAEDGSVLQGPATSGLSPVDVTVSGDQVTLA
jgi:nitrite reductase/ring-hydroxylating ferredoxin subunit